MRIEELAETPKPPRAGIFSRLRSSFFTGVVVIAPIGVTLWLIWTIVGWIDGWVLPFVPDRWQPDLYLTRWLETYTEGEFSVNFRGVGVVIFLVFSVLVGWIAKGVLGRSFLRWGERQVARMPVVRSVYNGLKQIAETVFAQSDSNFDQACMIEYPRKGSWAIAFISTTAKGEIRETFGTEDEMVAVFVPTTPNPTSGFLLFVPRSDLKMLEMSVEEAAKLVISAGLVYPDDKPKLS